MSKIYKYNDEFQQDDYIDEAESYGYEVKNIRRQTKKKVAMNAIHNCNDGTFFSHPTLVC